METKVPLVYSVLSTQQATRNVGLEVRNKTELKMLVW